MKMIEKRIRNLINGSENYELEFKSAKGGFPESFWQTFSAFANTNGGIIVLGIKHTNHKNIPDHLTEELINTYKKRFWDCAHNKEKVSATMLTERDVIDALVDGNRVLIFRIPRATYDIRPVYLNKNPFGNTYKRNQEGDYHCTKIEIDLMIKDSNIQSNDKTCLEEFTLEDLNLESILSYKQMLKASNPSHIFLTMPDEQFYLNLGIAKKGLDGLLHPTRAGLLMFGKEYRITDEFSHYFLDYQDHREATPEIRWIDRVQSSSGDWSGNVFDFFFKVYNKLIQDLFIPFKLEGVQRVDDTEMHKALREALCNTLSNADYYGTRGIVIKKYKDRVEFSNPGSMRMSIEEAFAGGNTDPRNETILKIFSLIKIGERAGTGIQQILRAINMFGYSKPIIEESFNPDRTKLTIFLEKIITITINDGEPHRVKVNSLSSDEEKTLEFIKVKKEIFRQDLEKYLSCSKTKCNNILKSLLQKGLIKKKDSGKNVKYSDNI